MPTVIDSLIITLGLDPTQFTKGQKEAANSFIKTRDEAVKSGKIIEDSAKKTADAISKVTREVLTLYATFLGARGIKEFVAQLDSADASLGRFSANLNQSPQTIAAWGAAAERMGGSADATAATFERIGKALYDLHRNGQMLPREFSQLQALTGRRIDTDHGVDRFLRDTASALKAMNGIDPAQAHFLAQGMGIDDATANTMIKYGDAIGDYIDQLKKLSPSNDAIKAAQQLQEQWVTLQQTAVSLANTVLEKLGPQLANLLQQMTDWLSKNQDWIKSGIVKAVGDFTGYLQSVDWNKVGQGLKDFGSEAKHVADAIGGITTATEVLFALWAGSKALGVIANLRTAVAGPAAPAAAAGGGGLWASIGGFAGLLAGGTGLAAALTLGRGGELRKLTPQQQAWLTRSGGIVEQPKIPYGSLARDPGAHGDALAGTVDGQPVSKANPLPVVITQSPSSGGGFWSSVGNAISSWFGGGSGGSAAGGSANGADSPLAAVGPSAGVRGWWTKERQQHAYERLTKEAGLSDMGAKGLISRWVNVEASGGPTESNNIGGGHFGIAQWSKSRGKSIWGNPDFDTQLGLAIQELNTSEKVAASLLRNAKTAAEGAIGASAYERAENYNPLSHRDNFTGKTLAGMRGIDKYVGSVMAGSTLSNIQSDHSVTTSNTSNAMHIGSMTIQTQATDAKGIANSISDSLFRSSLAATANSGPQ